MLNATVTKPNCGIFKYKRGDYRMRKSPLYFYKPNTQFLRKAGRLCCCLHLHQRQQVLQVGKDQHFEPGRTVLPPV